MCAALNEHGVPATPPEIAPGSRVRVRPNDARVLVGTEGRVLGVVPETGAYRVLIHEDSPSERPVSLLRDQLEVVAAPMPSRERQPEPEREPEKKATGHQDPAYKAAQAERMREMWRRKREAKAAEGKAALREAAREAADRPVAHRRGALDHQDERRAAAAPAAAPVAGAAGAGGATPERAGGTVDAGHPGRAVVPGEVAADRDDGAGGIAVPATVSGGGPAGGAAALEPAAAAGDRGGADPPAPTPLRPYKAPLRAATAGIGQDAKAVAVAALRGWLANAAMAGADAGTLRRITGVIEQAEGVGA